MALLALFGYLRNSVHRSFRPKVDRDVLCWLDVMAYYAVLHYTLELLLGLNTAIIVCSIGTRLDQSNVGING